MRLTEGGHRPWAAATSRFGDYALMWIGSGLPTIHSRRPSEMCAGAVRLPQAAGKLFFRPRRTASGGAVIKGKQAMVAFDAAHAAVHYPPDRRLRIWIAPRS